MNKEQEDLSSKKTDGSLWTPSQTEQSFMQKEVQRHHLQLLITKVSIGDLEVSCLQLSALLHRLRVALAERNADGPGLQERDQTWVNTSDRSANVRSITEAVRKDFGRDDLILVTSNGLPF